MGVFGTNDPDEIARTAEETGKFANVEAILRIPVTVQVVLGSATIPVANLMKLGRGAVVPLDHRVGEPVDVVVNGRIVARGEVVLDPFLGSGTTMIAAERIGRCCFGIEIDPLYVDTIIRRWQAFTGDTATHAVTGKRFDDLASEMEARHG